MKYGDSRRRSKRDPIQTVHQVGDTPLSENRRENGEHIRRRVPGIGEVPAGGHARRYRREMAATRCCGVEAGAGTTAAGQSASESSASSGFRTVWAGISREHMARISEVNI